MTIPIRRSAILVALGLLFAGANAHGGPYQTPTPVTPSNDAAHAVSWSGRVAGQSVSPGGAVPGVLNVDKQWFMPRLGSARRARATVWVHWETPEDLSLTVHDAKGGRISLSDRLPGQDEVVSFDVVNGYRFEVRVAGKVNALTNYAATLWIRDALGKNFVGPGRLAYVKPSLIARIEVPINLVLVGFDPVEVASYKNVIEPGLPKTFRPVVGSEVSEGGSGLIRREGGADVHSNAMLPGANQAVSQLPIEYRYKYRPGYVPYAVQDQRWTASLFAAMKAATRPGEFRNAFDREYLERYNARSGALRGTDHAVPPGQPVDFIDALAVESWIAAHPPPGVSFAQGYTMFVFDTFRSALAKQYFNPNRYHTFAVMNSYTQDPDSGAQNGFDWGRVWGGRWRFLFMDAGAAPNGHEGAVASTSVHRILESGDSAVLDPPVWEYRACSTATCPQPEQTANIDVDPVQLLYKRIAENLEMAIFLRFTRAPAFRPQASDRYIITSNSWHDSKAYVPWPSRLDKLYNSELVRTRIRELIPYARIDGTNRTKYLADSDPEQAALDQAKLQATARGPGLFSATSDPVVRLINSKQSTYLSTASGAIPLPVVNVVLPGPYTWNAPGPGDGPVESLGADSWGAVTGVNDLTKTPKATATVTDAHGGSHAAAPDPRTTTLAAGSLVFDSPTTAGRQGFSAQAIRRLGQTLGLYDATSGIGWDWRANPDPGIAAGYYRTVDWTFATTATPLSDAFTWTRFDVLDKDNLWTGHALDWIDRSLDNVSDAFAALDSKGYTRLTKPVEQATLASGGYMIKAISLMQAGLFREAVTAARTAVTLSEQLVITAAKTPKK